MSKQNVKTQSSWILPGLSTLLMIIVTIYCLLQYRSSVPIVGISTLLLLAAAYWLFLSIARSIKSKEVPALSVGDEQRDRMNYEGMKLQGEELIRVINMFGKGVYVNTKRTTERLDLLLEQMTQLQKSNTQLVQQLIEEQTRNAKFQVKYAQNDTGKLIAALNQQCENLDASIATCSAAIARISISTPAASAPVTSQVIDTQAITDSLNELSSELANINASIQELQQAFAAANIQTTIQPAMSEEVPVEEDILNEAGVPIEEVILNETAAPMEETVPNEAAAPMEEIVPDEVAAPMEETVPDEADMPIEETVPNEAATPDVSSLLSDDPNKQLSADEIAALFAALG